MLKRNLFSVILVLSGLAAAYGYWTWQLEPNLVGTVESRLHAVGALEGGRIEEMLVATGSQVMAGQIVARLGVSDLTAERALLQQQLVSLETILAADRQRYTLEYDLLRLRVSQQSASVQAGLAELNAINQEIQILQEAEAAGLGRGRDLARLLIRREALKQAVVEQSALIEERGAAASSEVPQVGRDTVLTSLLGDRMERIHQIRHRLTLIEQRLGYRVVKAPCDGRVVDVAVRQGSTVDAYQPILTVEDPRVSFVEVYLPEAQDRRVETGQRVEVYSRRSDQFNTSGHIHFVHPGFSRMPERLWLRGQMLWARKLRIELASDHALLPGESVRVRILKEQSDTVRSGVDSLSEDGSTIVTKGKGIPQGIGAGDEAQKGRGHVSIGS